MKVILYKGMMKSSMVTFLQCLILSNVNDVHFQSLDASRPWLVYWCVHALELLGVRLNDEEASSVVGFLGKCQNPEGGFGGGPGQYSHLAPTYAAVNALVIIGSPQALQLIDRLVRSMFVIMLVLFCLSHQLCTCDNVIQMQN